MAEKRTHKRPQARRRQDQARQGRARQEQERQGRARQGRARHTRPRRRRRGIPLAIYAITGIAAVLIVVTSIFACTRMSAGDKAASQGAEQATEQGSAGQSAGEGGTANKGAATVSFCAVGDNLINEGGDYTADLLGMADAWSGEKGDGAYDFTPFYAKIKPTISGYDIALVNQETVLGSNDDYEYQGYPSYNTPDEVAPAIADAGFDVVNFNSNHAFDIGSKAIEHAQGVWAKQDGVTLIGSYASEEDRANIRVLERNDMKIAFLSYSYGQNGYDQGDLPNDYYAVPFDKDKMKEEVAAAQKLADAVVVYMHWGEENTFELSDEQQNYASYLAGLGVDLVVGSHAHVIQPVRYVSRGVQTTEEDAGASATSTDPASSMLCVYGLGDFLSGYTLPKTILSGMFSCDFVRDANGDVSIQNPTWHGVVEHNDGTEGAVYLLSEYTQEQAESNNLLARVGENDEYTTSDPLAWAKQTTTEVVGDAIAVEV